MRLFTLVVMMAVLGFSTGCAASSRLPAPSPTSSPSRKLVVMGPVVPWEILRHTKISQKAQRQKKTREARVDTPELKAPPVEWVRGPVPTAMPRPRQYRNRLAYAHHVLLILQDIAWKKGLQFWAVKLGELTLDGNVMCGPLGSDYHQVNAENGPVQLCPEHGSAILVANGRLPRYAEGVNLSNLLITYVGSQYQSESDTACYAALILNGLTERGYLARQNRVNDEVRRWFSESSRTREAFDACATFR